MEEIKIAKSPWVVHLVHSARQVQLPEPAATWHHKPNLVCLNVVKVLTCPSVMNHLKQVDLFSVSLVCVSAFPYSVSSSFRHIHEVSHKEDFLEMMWFSFACVVWVCAHNSVYFCQKPKKNLFHFFSLCAWNWFYRHSQTWEFLRSIKKKSRETFLMIFFWESDPGKQTSAVCLEEGFGKRECSRIIVCICACVCEFEWGKLL